MNNQEKGLLYEKFIKSIIINNLGKNAYLWNECPENILIENKMFPDFLLQRRDDAEKLMAQERVEEKTGVDKYVQNGPFSWNGFDCHTNVKNWWREWPECKLRV